MALAWSAPPAFSLSRTRLETNESSPRGEDRGGRRPLSSVWRRLGLLGEEAWASFAERSRPCLFNYQQQRRQPCNTLAVRKHLASHALRRPHTSERWENKAFPPHTHTPPRPVLHTHSCAGPNAKRHTKWHALALFTPHLKSKLSASFMASHGPNPGKRSSLLTRGAAHTHTRSHATREASRTGNMPLFYLNPLLSPSLQPAISNTKNDLESSQRSRTLLIWVRSGRPNPFILGQNKH